MKKIISDTLKAQCERFIKAYDYLIEEGKIKDKSDLAKKIKLKHVQKIYDIFNFYQSPSIEMLDELEKVFGISKVYILLGNDQMLKTVKTGTPESLIHYIRLLPIAAIGGSLTNFTATVMDFECEKIISPIKDADFAITVSGNSMHPEFPAGSQILIKKIDGNRFVEWGRTYVLDTCNGVVVKKIIKGDPGYYRCISVNPDQETYAPFDVAFEDVFAIYRVLMIMSMK